jgi:Ca2+-binding EF-hand superfamily protein
MKRQFQFSLTILRYGIRLLVWCLLANTLALRGQGTPFIMSGTPRSPSDLRTGDTGGQFGLVINGSDIGTILLKACDLDQNGGVTLPELKEVVTAYFKLWDINTDGNLNGHELSTGLKELFPAPPPGGVHGVRVVNGVAVDVSPADFPTPDTQVARHILAGADSNKDGSLSIPELSDFLDTSFSQWDRDGNGWLDAQEITVVFSQLTLPDSGSPGFSVK